MRNWLPLLDRLFQLQDGNKTGFYVYIPIFLLIFLFFVVIEQWINSSPLLAFRHFRKLNNTKQNNTNTKQ